MMLTKKVIQENFQLSSSILTYATVPDRGVQLGQVALPPALATSSQQYRYLSTWQNQYCLLTVLLLAVVTEYQRCRCQTLQLNADYSNLHHCCVCISVCMFHCCKVTYYVLREFLLYLCVFCVMNKCSYFYPIADAGTGKVRADVATRTAYPHCMPLNPDYVHSTNYLKLCMLVKYE